MSMVPFKVLAAILFMGFLPALADEAGKAAAKAYSHAAKAAPQEAGAKAAPRGQGAAPGPGRMQVEEPASRTGEADARAPKAWQKSHSKGLTDEQKAAFRERKEKMEGMIALIKAKRKALQDAKPEERAALARELHSLILEKDPDAASSMAAAVRIDGKGAGTAGAEAAAGAAAAEADKSEVRKETEAQAERREEIRERELERLKKTKVKSEDD